ncbi:MAG TPA: hypothetical protein VFS31_06545, partial [Chitinophagaceae bacterium]|nr:hypothetical protein [Chitinophagaceae bacterium]
GVIGATSVSDIVADVYKTINYAPRWTLDKQNGSIAVNYFVNAGIPSTAYGGADSAGWKTPADLDACDDIFVMPHADPTWATHNNLYYWNRDYRGNIWAACHAVSVLESLKDPSNTIQMNFLSTTGLVQWKDHKKDEVPPYSYNSSTDPVMQFMGSLDGATNNGSEKSYIPLLGGGWRTSTTVSVVNNNAPSIPALSAGPSAIVAYGRAYGDDSRGWVMYEAGHDHNSGGSESEKVAAQRAFFNYSFQVAYNKFENPSAVINGLPEVIVPGMPIDLSFTVPSTVDLSRYSITWTSTAGGNFSPDVHAQNVTYTPPASYTGACVVSLVLTDGCGNDYFSSQGTYASGVLSVAAPVLKIAGVSTDDRTVLNWMAPSDQNCSYYEVQKSDDGRDFENIALLMRASNSGQLNYQYTDPAGIQKGEEVYYRIVAVLPGQKQVYSNIVLMKTDKSALSRGSPVRLLNNPVRGLLRFEYSAESNDQINIQLIDPSGRVMGTHSQWIPKGLSIVQAGDYRQLPAGTYLLRVQGSRSASTTMVQLIR